MAFATTVAMHRGEVKSQFLVNGLDEEREEILSLSVPEENTDRNRNRRKQQENGIKSFGRAITNRNNAIQSVTSGSTKPISTVQNEIVPVVDIDIASGTSNSSFDPNFVRSVGVAAPAPSVVEVTVEILPAAAQELVSASLRRLYHAAHLTYAKGRWHRKYSDLGNNAGGYAPPPNTHITTKTRKRLSLSQRDGTNAIQLPPFSCLSWLDRQLVEEWRSYRPHENENEDENDNDNLSFTSTCDHSEEDLEFERARALVPKPLSRPRWQKADFCAACHKAFGPTRLRHHCRLCGSSFCQAHSSRSHRLPHFGYDPDVPERVCESCKTALVDQNLAERVAWRLARCRDLENGCLAPYFETGVETFEQAAFRIAQAAIDMAKRIPLGMQAKVAVETVDVLRRHGLNGIYTILLRQEFLVAADLLRKALGIDSTAWPLSVHELSAAIFYALAQHRAFRGMNPEREHIIHGIRNTSGSTNTRQDATLSVVLDEVVDDGYPVVGTQPTRNTPQDTDTEVKEAARGKPITSEDELSFQPVCDPLPDSVLSALIFYSPLALNFVYAEKEVDMQLLAAQQGWRLLYAFLQQEVGHKENDRPASALFVHEKLKIACLAIRGTATIQDVITDIRQMPVPFPDADQDDASSMKSEDLEDWLQVSQGNGLAVSGMATAAVNLYREHIDALMHFVQQGYRIRLTGHSLGGGVATLLGILLRRDLLSSSDFLDAKCRVELSRGMDLEERTATLKVYAFGTPSCVDQRLSEFVQAFVTTVVLHDDVVPRLTPASCRGLLKHLLHIRETWVKAHLPDDLMAITERAAKAWAPRWRGSFTISSSSSSIKRYCNRQIQFGKRKLLSVGRILVGADHDNLSSAYHDGGNWSDEQPIVDQVEEKGDMVAHTSNDEWMGELGSEPKLLLDYMGGVDKNSCGVLIDGEEFFDTDNLVETSDDEASHAKLEAFADALAESREALKNPFGSFQYCGSRANTTTKRSEPLKSSSVQPTAAPNNEEGSQSSSHCDDSGLDNDEDNPGAVFLDEIPLPRMFVPGRVVHIYAHRGVYRATFVPRTFRELRRISLAGNLLNDHKCKEYYEALLEVRAVRSAPEHPPRWTAFDEDHTCSCCASRFTWASTSHSKAQEARDKHNCRSCGALVCHPCSTNRVPIPSIGLTVPVRVCDRCYHDIDGVMSGAGNSVINPNHFWTEAAARDADNKPVRHREKRSAIVDELASRLKC